jgi:hypothetical protein
MFRDAFKRKRLLIPASGYYESHEGYRCPFLFFRWDTVSKKPSVCLRSFGVPVWVKLLILIIPDAPARGAKLNQRLRRKHLAAKQARQHFDRI